MRNADDYYSTSVPGWKCENPGDEIVGTIVERQPQQVREYIDGKTLGDLMWWIDGKPRAMPEEQASAKGYRAYTQYVVTLQTDLRDPSIDDDDGQRRLFIKGKRFDTAIKEALKRAGVKKLADGGRLRVRFTDWDPESQNPKNPAKLYAALYDPPTTAADDYFGDPSEPPADDPWGSQPAPSNVDTSTGEITSPADSVKSPIATVADEAWATFDRPTREALVNLHASKLASTP